MPSLKPSQDVQPLSAFRANAAGFLEQVRTTKRPLVLTQHGKRVAVVLDVDQYEALVEEIEVTRDIRQAKAELARGDRISHEEVVAELRARLVVVGWFPGTGVPAFRNVRTAGMNKRTAVSTPVTPIGALTESGSIGTGQKECTSNPRQIEPR